LADVEILTVECLGCGEARRVYRTGDGHVASGECSRCAYVGWANPSELSELTRRALRNRPLERRRLLRRAS
jgi:hypothetical protein